MESLDAASRHAIINRAHAGSPVALAQLARIVAEAHESGDRDATGILNGAITHLDHLAESLVASGGLQGPLVLAGALVSGRSYVGSGLLERLHSRGVATSAAADPVLGAVRLAQRHAAGDRI